MAKLTPSHESLVQVDLFADGVFDTSDVATVKPDGSAWIDRETGRETSFHWQDVAMPISGKPHHNEAICPAAGRIGKMSNADHVLRAACSIPLKGEIQEGFAGVKKGCRPCQAGSKARHRPL